MLFVSEYLPSPYIPPYWSFSWFPLTSLQLHHPHLFPSPYKGAKNRPTSEIRRIRESVRKNRMKKMMNKIRKNYLDFDNRLIKKNFLKRNDPTESDGQETVPVWADDAGTTTKPKIKRIIGTVRILI